MSEAKASIKLTQKEYGYLLSQALVLKSLIERELVTAETLEIVVNDLKEKGMFT